MSSRVPSDLIHSVKEFSLLPEDIPHLQSALSGPVLTHLLPGEPGVAPSPIRISSNTRMSPPPPSPGHHSCWPGTARMGLHQLPSIQKLHPAGMPSAVPAPEAAGAGFNPQSPPGFPLLPITFSHPILHNPLGSLSQPGGDRGDLCVPLSRGQRCHRCPGRHLLVPHFSVAFRCRMEPLSARSSAGRAAPRLSVSLEGCWKGVEIPTSCCCQELHTHGQGWERAGHREPRQGLSPERGTGGQSPRLWVTWSGDSVSPVAGAGAPGMTAMPTVGKVSLLPPVLMQAGESRWGTLTWRCHHKVSQSTQRSPNSLGSSKAKPAPGPGQPQLLPKPLERGPCRSCLDGAVSWRCPRAQPCARVAFLCPALCQAVRGGLGAGQTRGGQHGAHCQPGCPSVRAQILPLRITHSINK